LNPIDRPRTPGCCQPHPHSSHRRKSLFVVSGPRGVEIGDAMEAYEVLARSDLYNLGTVAPESKPLSLNPGPALGGSGIDFTPHFSFADYVICGRSAIYRKIGFADTSQW
jgi:hypothetical protein